MKKKISSIVTINMIPPLIFFALICAYSFWIFIPGLKRTADAGNTTGQLMASLLPYTAGLLLLIGILFIAVTVRGLRLELSREKLKESAVQLDEELQAWVETTADGFIYIPEGGGPAADEIVLNLTGYRQEEFVRMEPSDFINSDLDGTELLGYIQDSGEDPTGRYETRLVRKDSETVEVLISASRISSGKMHGVILIVKDLSEQTRTGAVRIDVQREYTLVELQSALQFIYQRAGSMMVAPLLFSMQTKIIEAVDVMNTAHRNNFIVIDENGKAAGIVTDQDLRQRVLAGGLSLELPVSAIMSSPVITANSEIMFFEAFRLMRDSSIRQLVILDNERKPAGLLTEKRLLEIQSANTATFIEELQNARNINEMRDCYLRLVFSVRILVLSGAKASYIVSLVSRTSELITSKILDEAMKKFGPSPCDFAFISMGSEGRGEQTLFTDQDNGIIFDDASPDAEAVRKYFLKVGGWVSESLHYIGYSFCKGDVMASNPKWVRSASEWKSQIYGWFAGESPDRLLDLNILFDFRHAYGSRELSHGLRCDIWAALERYPGFLKEMAAAVSIFKPGLTLFGRIQTDFTEEDDEVFDIKKALGPLVIFARTMAMKEKIEITSTRKRLKLLKERSVLTEQQYRNFEQAFDFLTQLRFRDQVQTIEDGEEMNNLIYIEDLSEVEIIALRRIFKQISSAQDYLRLALTGSIRQA